VKLVIVKLIYVFIQINKILTGNVYGIFVIALCAYFLSFRLTGVRPYGINELLLSVDGLETAYQIALFSSFITVVGFFIAFHVAAVNWKQQLQANLRVGAVNEIDLTYARINELILNIQIYIDMNIDLIKTIRNGSEREAFYSLKYLLPENLKFLSNRNELSSLYKKSFEIYGRYSTIFFATWNSLDWLERVNKSVGNVADSMWIQVPEVDLEVPNFSEQYLAYVNENELLSLSEQCEKTRGEVAFLSGAVRGELLTPVVEFNIPFAVNFLIRKRKLIKQVTSEINLFSKK